MSSNSISLQWDAATDNVGVTGYRVSRNGQTIATVGTTSLDDSGLQPATAYDYSVRALDAAGNESAAATINVVTNAPAADTEAPTSPANLRTTAVSSTSISLQWDAASDNVGVTAYRVLRGGRYLATVYALSFTNSGLQVSTTYAYSVSAIDAAGNGSVQTTISATTNPATGAPNNSSGSGAADLLFLIGLVLLLRRRAVRNV